MNNKLSKYIDKAREQRIYSEEKEDAELEAAEETAGEEGSEETQETEEEIVDTIKGTVKRVFPFTANAESAANSVAVIYVSSSHALKVRGRTIVVPSKSFIPVMLSGKASGSVELKYNEDKLQFEVVAESKGEEGSEE